MNPYDDSFYKPVKVIGRVMPEEEARAEEEKGNHVTKTDAGYRRIVSAPKPEDIVEIDAIRALLDADQIVVLDEGRVAGKGTHRQLLEDCPQYLEIALSQLSEEELALGGDAA